MLSLAALAALLALAGGDPAHSRGACEPILVETCKSVGYNSTAMPNFARHAAQADADVTLMTFAPLLQYGCSSQLRFFLCSVYAPMCADKVPVPIGPCRGLCETVYSRCFPVLSEFGFPWPADFECDRFPPENNHEHMCMEGPGETGAPASTPPSDRTSSSKCRDGFAHLERSGRCAQLCEAELLYDAADRRLAEVWLSIWAALCFLATLAAVLTALAGSAERAPSLMALCHNLAAVGWGVRAAAGRAAVACTADSSSPASRVLLSRDGLSNPNCAVVFLMLYYFGAAASVWWVVLTETWRARVVGRAKGTTIERRGPPLQLAAWGLPALQTVAVLVLRDVDADELTGTCFVGNQSTRSLLLLVIIPHLIYLCVGCFLLILGFRALFAPPHPSTVPALPTTNPMARKDPADDVNLVRLGIFAVIYIVPTSCIIASWIYEYIYRDSWLAAVEPSPTASIAPKPALWVFLLRILMLQILGVLTSLWVMSPKALQSWKCLFSKMGPATYKPPPMICVPQQIPTQYYSTPQMHSLPKRPHSHSKYSTHHNSYRKPRSHHGHQMSLPGGETML